MKHIKDGVSLVKLAQVMLDACLTMQEVFTKHNVDFVITAGDDGNHMTGSLHYRGYAVDLRSRHLGLVQQALILSDIKLQLGNDFDCILEGDHVHVEYDPQHNGGKNLP